MPVSNMPLSRFGKTRQVRGMGRRRGPQGKEYLERRAFIERLMLAGCTQNQVIDIAGSQGIHEHIAKADYNAICDKWTKQSEDELQHARAQAIQRIRGDLAVMRMGLEEEAKAKKGKGKKRGARTDLGDATYKDLAAHERLLAQIEGTLRPVEVKVDIRATSRRSLIDVINAMSPDDMDRLVAEQRAIEMASRRG